MSEPGTDAGPAEDAPPPRTGFWRRWLRRLLWTVGSLAFLVLLLHTPPAKRLLTGALVRLVERALGADVVVERVDYRLWEAWVLAEGVEVRRERLEIDVGRVEAEVDAGVGLRVRLGSPRVMVQQGPERRRDEPRGPSQPWSVGRHFGAVTLDDGALELRDREGQPWLRLEGVEARLESPDGHPRGSGAVTALAVGWPGAGIRLEGISGEAEIQLDPDTGAVRILEGAVTRGATRLRGRGQLRQIDPILADAEGEGRLDVALARDLAPALDLEGLVDARVSFEKDGGGARGTLQARASGVKAFQVGPWDGEVQGHLEDWVLHVDSLDVAGYQGRARGDGIIALRGEASRLNVRVSGLDTRTLVGTFVEKAPPLATRAEASLHLTLQDWNLDTLEARGDVALSPGPGPGWPLEGPVDVSLAGRRVGFRADRLGVRRAQVAARGSLTFSKDLDLEFSALLPDLDDGRELLEDAGVEVPPLALAGPLEATGSLAGRFPDWSGTARLASPGLSVEGLDAGLEGELDLARAGIRVRSLEIAGEDGRASMTGFVPLQDDGAWDVLLEIPHLRLTDALDRHGIPVPTTGQGRAAIEGPRSDPQAAVSFEARSEPPLVGAGEDTEGDLGDDVVPNPEPAAFRMAARASRLGIEVEEAVAEIGGGRLTGQGAWDSEDDRLSGRLALAEVDLQRLPWTPLPERLRPLAAVASGEADLSGTLAEPEGRVRVRLEEGAFGDEPLPDLSLEAILAGAVADLTGRLDGQELFTGRLSFQEDWPLRIDANLGVVPTTRLVRALPGDAASERELEARGRAVVEVPLGAMERVSYELRVDSLDMNLGAGGSSAGPFVVKGGRDGVSIHGFELEGGGARLRAEGTLGLAADSGSPLELEGTLPLADFAVLLADGELRGTAEMDLQVTGRVRSPELVGTARIVGGEGRVGPVSWTDLEVASTARGGVLEIERGSVQVAGGEVRWRGSLPMGPRTEEVRTLEIEVQGVDPGSLVEVDPGEPRLSAPLDASGRVRAAALKLDAVEAEGAITRWSIAAGSHSLSLQEPARWRVGRDGLRLEGLRLVGADGGALGLDGAWTDEGLRAEATGAADLAFLNPFLGGELRVSGPSQIDMTLTAESLEDLALDGRVSLENARASFREPPLQVRNLSGSLEARGSTVTLHAEGEIGDGRVATEGTVNLSASGPVVDVRLNADRVPLTFPEGLRSRSSGQVRVKGQQNRYRIDGEVTVHRALFERETDMSNQALDLIGAELAALDERGSLMERVQLDVRVRLEDGLRVQNRQLDLVVDGAVAVLGDLLTPEVRGSVSIRDGGTVRMSRSTMRLVDGRVDLAGFPSRPPEIDVSGRTQITGIQVDVDLTGPLDDLRTSLSSPNRSDLTQADLATLLLTGRTAQAAASESGAIVAEEVAAALGSALNERLGGAVMIDVSRDESLIVQDVDPTQRFNVGVPLGERLYVIYSQALDRSGVRWILDVRPTGRFRVRLITDSNDTSAIEVSHSLNFDLWSRGKRVRPGRAPVARVRHVSVAGVPEPLAGELLRKSKVEAGDQYDFFRGEKAARRMREALVDAGFRAAVVEARESGADQGRVDVVFEVDTGPRIQVEWEGDDPGRKLRNRFGGTWDAFLSVEETAGRRAQGLELELRARRFYGAAVSARVEELGGTTSVTFDVSRGRRGQGVDLVFEGNDSLSDEALAAVLPPRDEADFFRLLGPRGAAPLGAALRTAGARQGFLSLEVGTPRTAFDPETERLQVTFPVDEGERAVLLSLALPVESVPQGLALPELKLEVGQPFHIDDYIDDRRTLASWFRRQGFPDARIAGVLDPEPGGMAVEFVVDAGPRPTVGEIREARTGRTRPSVIDDALDLGPGDLIRPEALASTRDHLSETRVFRSVDVRAETTQDASVRDLVIDLAERPDLAVEYKVRYETNVNSTGTSEQPTTEESGGFQFGAGIEAANPFGRAHRYSVYGLVGKRRTLYGTTFEAQTFFGKRWRTQVFVFDDSDTNFDNTSIARRIRNASFQQTKRWRSGLLGRRWHDRLRLQWGYGFRKINYLDPVTSDELWGNRAGLTGSLIGDTRDSVTDPHHGLFWTLTAEPNLEALGSDKNLVRLYGQVFAYVPLGSKTVWAQALRIGAAPGDDPLLLLDRRFKAGGATTVRGFPENALGPQLRDVSLGGQALFVFNQELRFPIWNRVHGGLFFDTGNVWALASDLSLKDLRSNVGAGIRVMFPFGPLRLDWAWVLDPLDGEQRSRWQFALGHAF